ncbi:MAG: hypothetical protein ACHQNE_00805 [Candidatus Kapaibacterium sp.]
MMILRSSAWWLLIGLSFAGCSTPTGPAQVISCAGNPQYSFVTGDGWLIAGHSLYSIAYPSNPLLHSNGGNAEEYYGDTAFIFEGIQYTENNSSISFDSVGSQIYPQYEELTAYPRSLAFAPGYLYFLRHKTYPGGNEFCSQMPDTVNELDVDRFTDTSYAASLLAQVPLTDPAGIAIMDSSLFVLDAGSGLKTFSLSDPAHPALIGTVPNVQGYHIQVTGQSTLLVTSSTGVAQYDISNPANPRLLSMIQ